MAAEGTDPVDENSIPVRVNVAGRSTAAPQAESSSQTTVAPASELAQAPAPKRRMIITHDKYIELQSMVIMYVSEQEQKIGKGVDREELIDWYLEQREESMQDVEQFEYEKELIVKLLRKLVKVCSRPSLLYYILIIRLLQDNFLIEVRGDVQDSLRPSTDDDSQGSTGVAGEDVRVYYLVHPSVDTESSMTSGY
jgi:DNA replication licensing factor MCM6